MREKERKERKERRTWSYDRPKREVRAKKDNKKSGGSVKDDHCKTLFVQGVQCARYAKDRSARSANCAKGAPSTSFADKMDLKSQVRHLLTSSL